MLVLLKQMNKWRSFSDSFYFQINERQYLLFHLTIVGFDGLFEIIGANYRKVKEEILSLVDLEIMRIKNDPKLAHLIKM